MTTALLNPDEVASSWAGWVWPDWVPQEVRDQIEGFWGAQNGRNPKAWLRNAQENGAPPLGAHVLARGLGPTGPWHEGRYVHAWNNIARVVPARKSVWADKSFEYATSTGTCVPDGKGGWTQFKAAEEVCGKKGV